MMREIKFRAWDKDKKQMLPVCDMSFGDDGRALTVIFQTAPKEKYYRGLVYGENGILMQYIGLKDRSGKEIYEGDIVSYGVRGLGNIGSNKLEHKLYGPVEWMQGSCCWWLVDNHMGAGNIYEIIGNIHENPELVKAQ